VLAVDGGNTKTDLALVDAGGSPLALVRGGQSSPHYIGLDHTIQLLSELLAEAVSQAGLGPDRVLPVEVAQIMVAGADLPEELMALRSRIEALEWAQLLLVDNDTVALLRSGTARGWGVAVVCGSGINCLGIAPDGRQARFPSLGAITGDWGGGTDVGLEGLSAAARSADGRGPKTALETAVPSHFGFAEPFELARAIHLRELPGEQLGQLAPVVFEAAEGGDAVAAGIVGRVTAAVVSYAAAALERLRLTDQAPDVVLGGGLMRAASPSVLQAIERGVRAVAPAATLVVSHTGPIVGATLLGLDRLGADADALARARAELHAAFTRVEEAGVSVDGGRRSGLESGKAGITQR
jgi:N-acetylglucosamine kinase-like BadF-type ATPase